MTRQRWFLIAALLVASAAVLLLTITRPEAQEKQPIVSEAKGAVAAPGIVEPATEEREVAAEVSGLLTEVLVEENESVRAGQPLALIKNDELKAKLDGARALVALRKSELRRLLNGARAQERRGAAAQVNEAEALLRFTKVDFARAEKLMKTGTISAAAYDESRYAHESASAKLDSAKENLSLIKAPARDDEVAQAKAMVDAAIASVTEMEALLDKTTVTSPIDGTILRRYKDGGEVVTMQPLTLVFTVGDLSRLRVRAEIDEADIAAVRPGQRVSVAADAFRGERFGGKVVRVANRLGSKSIQTERPSEKADTKVLEAIIELDPEVKLPVGLRVDVFVD